LHPPATARPRALFRGRVHPRPRASSPAARPADVPPPQAGHGPARRPGRCSRHARGDRYPDAPHAPDRGVPRRRTGRRAPPGHDAEKGRGGDGGV